MHRLLIFLAVALFSLLMAMWACKKEQAKIIFKGTVNDPNLHQPVANARVTLSSSSVSNGFYNPNYNDIATTTTLSDGSFSFEFDKQKSAGYRVYISKDNYFDNTIDIPESDITAGSAYTPTYALYPAGFITLHVKNVSPFDTTDMIAYSFSSVQTSCFQCCSNATVKGYGTHYETTSSCRTYGANYVRINWHVFKFGSDVSYSDSVYCTPFDTTYYQLLY